MEDTNPQGSVKTVSDAAEAFLGMLEPQEPEGQPEEQAAESEESFETEEYAEQEESQEEQEQPSYRVKVDNEEVEVTLDELLKGYSRTSDYTKKTQTLAEQRKAVEAERTKIEEAAKLRDQYAQRLGIIEQMLTSQPEENLAELKDTDPIGYAVKVAERAERDKQLAAVRAERQQLAQRQQAEQQERLQMHLTQEQERLKAAIPELADQVKGEVIRKEIRDFAKSIGFSDQELTQVYDHRAVMTLYKAMQYDKLQKSRPEATKKVTQAPRMMRPGTSTPEARETQESKKMREQLKRSGSKNDAARIFERLL
jgi:hypothetical protein